LAVQLSDYNPISHWLCDETSGVRYDSNTTNTNDLTDNNTVLYAASLKNNACDFETTNSESLSITDASHTSLDFSTTFSVSAWIRLESDTSGAIISKEADTNASTRGYMFAYSGNDLYALVGNGSGSFDYYETTANIIPSTNGSTWYHVVLTTDVGNPSASTFKFYVDGVDKGSGTAVLGNNITTINNNGIDFNIGSKNTGTQSNFDGLIDEVSVFSTVLSQSEVIALYNSGTPLDYTSTGTSTATSTASSTLNTGDIVYSLSVIIMLLVLMTVGFLWSAFKKK